MARTHMKLFQDTLAESFGHQRARFDEIADALGEHWTAGRVERKAREFDRLPKSGIHVVKGGVVFYRETSAMPDLYLNVRRNIVRRWGPDNSMRAISSVPTARTSKSRLGKWSQPDLVARVDRKSNARPEIVYHSIEVERPGAFGIDSVYQAYECARGAHFAWVFFTGADPYKETERSTYMDRIDEAASELGVGLVHAPRPTAPSQWRTRRPATILRRSAATDDFFDRCGLTSDFQAGRVGGVDYS